MPQRRDRGIVAQVRRAGGRASLFKAIRQVSGLSAFSATGRMAQMETQH